MVATVGLAEWIIDDTCLVPYNSRTSEKRPNLSKAEEKKLSREERRRRRRASLKYRMAHATRERLRVEAFNSAFQTLRQLLPTLPPDKKLSKIEILRLAICYITYLNNVLQPELEEALNDCCKQAVEVGDFKIVQNYF